MSQWSSVAIFWGPQKISQTFGERAFAKFCDKNAVFVNFCNKNVTFSKTRYPKIPDFSENISGWVRVLLKINGSGRVLGTRLTLSWSSKLISLCYYAFCHYQCNLHLRRYFLKHRLETIECGEGGETQNILEVCFGKISLDLHKAIFLDAIASPSSWCCQWASGPVSDS